MNHRLGLALTGSCGGLGVLFASRVYHALRSALNLVSFIRPTPDCAAVNHTGAGLVKTSTTHVRLYVMAGLVGAIGFLIVPNRSCGEPMSQDRRRLPVLPDRRRRIPSTRVHGLVCDPRQRAMRRRTSSWDCVPQRRVTPNNDCARTDRRNRQIAPRSGPRPRIVTTWTWAGWSVEHLRFRRWGLGDADEFLPPRPHEEPRRRGCTAGRHPPGWRAIHRSPRPQDHGVAFMIIAALVGGSPPCRDRRFPPAGSLPRRPAARPPRPDGRGGHSPRWSQSGTPRGHTVGRLRGSRPPGAHPGDPARGRTRPGDLEFASPAAAAAAAAEQATYVASGVGRVQFPPDSRFSIRVVGATAVFFTWSPANSPDARIESIPAALESIGTAVPIPN